MVHGLSSPMLPDEEEAVAGACMVIVEAASDEGAGASGGQLIFDPKQGKPFLPNPSMTFHDLPSWHVSGKLVPVAPKSCVFVPPPTTTTTGKSPRDETEEEEIPSPEELFGSHDDDADDAAADSPLEFAAEGRRP